MAAAFVAAITPLPVHPQDVPSPAARATGWETTGIPALNFNSDEGFGYGAILQVYNYGDAGAEPYRFTIQPTIFFTTKGRRDYTVYFDAPHLLPNAFRLDAFAGSERQLAAPYYGIGNTTNFDEAADEDPNKYYYRFGRRVLKFTTNVQRSLGPRALRGLVGVGVERTRVDLTPFDEGITLMSQELRGVTPPDTRAHYMRAGLIWDTRDREVGPHRGNWSELLVQRVDESLGSTSSYTRATLTMRQYIPLGDRVTLANREIVQSVVGDAPVADLFTIQSSYRQQEGLGGASSVRGLPKNRYVGKGMFVTNTELRWRAADFSLMRKPAYVVLSTFFDAGRVWDDRVEPGELLSDLHAGYGAGVRLGLGPNFVVALDVGHSSEATAPIYLGLGYLF